MANNGYQDISALLKSLTSFPSAYALPAPAEQQAPQPQHHAQQPAPDVDIDPISASSPDQVIRNQQAYADLSHTLTPYNQSLQPTQIPDQHHFQSSTPQPRHSHLPQHSTPSTIVSAVTKATPDPRTITTWPAALRHVTNLLAQNASLSESIKKLIANQAENEQQWWNGRQALLSQQAARKDGQRQLDDVLRSVGIAPSTPTAESPQAELQRYDAKVHAAAVKMTRVMSAELQDLRVPFFGTRAECIVAEAGGSGGPKLAQESDAEAAQMMAAKAAGRGGKITRLELARLQRKMLAFLEEYCKD